MSDVQQRQADERLVQRAQRGDPAAFGELVEWHMGMVFAIACARLGDRERAEDLAQEVFLRAFLSLGQLRDPRQFAAWLSRTTRNLAINWLRRDGRISRLTPLVDMSAIDNVPDTETKGAQQRMETAEREQAVWKAILDLESEEREVILLHFTEDLTATEISKRLGVHQTTITRRLQRALRRMEGLLTPLLREVGPALRPRHLITTKTVATVAAAAAMSGAAKAALAASATQEAASLGQATVGLVGSIKAASAAIITGITLGGKAMATGKGIIALIGAAALVGGGIALTQGDSDQSPAPTNSTPRSPGMVVESNAPTPTTASTSNAPHLYATLADGSRVTLPQLTDADAQEAMANVTAPPDMFRVLQGMGKLGVLPHEFTLTITGDDLSVDAISVMAPPAQAVNNAMSVVMITVGGGVTVPAEMQAPHEVKPSAAVAGAMELSFPAPLPNDFIIYSDERTDPTFRAVIVLAEDADGVEEKLNQLQQPNAMVEAPNDPSSVRHTVARVKADMRSMATAIESFFIDNNRYPASELGFDGDSDASASPLLDRMPTFSTRESLTRPIAYMNRLMPDPFIDQTPGLSTYSYYSDGPGWILISPGPDMVFNINPRADYSSRFQQPSPALRQLEFDPTNGELSGGDIFRVKQ